MPNRISALHPDQFSYLVGGTSSLLNDCRSCLEQLVRLDNKRLDTITFLRDGIGKHLWKINMFTLLTTADKVFGKGKTYHLSLSELFDYLTDPVNQPLVEKQLRHPRYAPDIIPTWTKRTEVDIWALQGKFSLDKHSDTVDVIQHFRNKVTAHSPGPHKEVPKRKDLPSLVALEALFTQGSDIINDLTTGLGMMPNNYKSEAQKLDQVIAAFYASQKH